MTSSKTNEPLISVIMPAYNTAALIAESLDSVFAQTYTNFEVIVVNDGSPDTADLERVLAPYLRRIVYITQENKRAAGARNTAIKNAKGAFLAFLDSDDRWLPDHLDSQMKLFEQDPALDLTYADGWVFSDPEHQWRFMERCPSTGEATFASLIQERCQIPVSTVVARRGAIVRAGLFDETLPCFDDYDMWLRTAFFGGKIAYTTRAQARMAGRRPGSLSQSAAKMADAYELILQKMLRTLPLSQSEKDLVSRRLDEARATHQLEEGNRKLRSRDFAKAQELFREANRHFRRPGVSLAVFALALAPHAAGKLIEMLSRMRRATSN